MTKKFDGVLWQWLLDNVLSRLMPSPADADNGAVLIADGEGGAAWSSSGGGDGGDGGDDETDGGRVSLISNSIFKMRRNDSGPFAYSFDNLYSSLVMAADSDLVGDLNGEATNPYFSTSTMTDQISCYIPSRLLEGKQGIIIALKASGYSANTIATPLYVYVPCAMHTESFPAAADLVPDGTPVGTEVRTMISRGVGSIADYGDLMDSMPADQKLIYCNAALYVAYQRTTVDGSEQTLSSYALRLVGGAGGTTDTMPSSSGLDVVGMWTVEGEGWTVPPLPTVTPAP